MNYILIISRFAAFLIDYIVLYACTYLFSWLGAMGYIISLLILFIYRYITTSIWGATVGMMLLRLRLVNYGFKSCLKREIYRISSTFFYLGYIYALFNRKHQTFHDNASGTYVVFAGSADTEVKEVEKNRVFYIISTILLVIAALRGVIYIGLNDIGLIGLKRVYTSDEYYQSFEGDNLVSLSQDELYMKTMGRKYVTVVDIGGKPSLIRLSNKLKYTEVYRLNLDKNSIVGQYLYRVDMPIQYVCSGNFRGQVDMCGISPQNNIILVDEEGNIYGKENVKLESILTVRCGDIDQDGRDESVVLGRGGDVEIFQMEGEKLKKIYSGKIGEDIMPESFYIDKGLVVVGKAKDKKLLYFYDFKDGKFEFKNKKDFNIKEVSSISKLGNNIIASHVFRNSMTFRRGNTQLLEVYSIGKGVNRLYNFGSRPGRGYSYMVRVLENIIDIDGDGEEEIVLKAVGKDDVMGEAYIVEIYRMRRNMMGLNRVMSWMEEILY